MGQLSEIEEFSKEVLDEMIRQNVPPTPSNFYIYFDKLIEDKPSDCRRELLKILELENYSDQEESILKEQNLKEAYLNIKKFMHFISEIYKSVSKLLSILQKRRYEIEKIVDNAGLNSVIASIERDAVTIRDIIRRESRNIKNTYQATSYLVEDVQNLAIYDSRYDVYKKIYFLRKVEQEIKLMKEFDHESSVMLISVKREMLSRYSPKIIQMITRTIAKLILKTSRRSDMIALYDEHTFVVLMRYTTIENAGKTAERFKDIILNTSFFVKENEINLDVDIGIGNIKIEESIEDTIKGVLKSIDTARKENQPFGIYYNK